MKIRKNIESEINREIQYALDDLDIDGMVMELISSKNVGEYVERFIKDKLAQLIQEKAYLKLKKAYPIIDAYTESKVQAFLYELGVK